MDIIIQSDLKIDDDISDKFRSKELQLVLVQAENHGARPYMEDRSLIRFTKTKNGEPMAFAGVFDGKTLSGTHGPL